MPEYIAGNLNLGNLKLGNFKVLFVPYIFMEWFQIEKNHGGKCPNLLLFVQVVVFVVVQCRMERERHSQEKKR